MAEPHLPPVYEVDKYEPMQGRARAAVFLLWLCVALAAAGVVSDLMEHSLLSRIEQGDFISQADLIDAVDSNDRRQGLIGGTQLALQVVAGIVFIAWFYGMYKNLRLMGRHPRHGTGWAIGGWFVPILNLWRPKDIADQIYRGSDPDSGYTDPLWEERTVPAVMHFWWAAWVGALILWRVSAVMSREALQGADISEYKNATIAMTVADILTVIAGILAVIVVRKLTERQAAWAANHLNAEAISSSV
jgi:hypothetical protein